jgi:Bacterial conjugation TrbI-like protein
MNFLRSKGGLVILAMAVVAVFFTLSKLKQRRAAERAAQEAKFGTPGSGRAEEAAQLKRAQETARARADDVKQVKRMERNSSDGYDEAGNAYRRRSTPEPMAASTPLEQSSHGEELRAEPLLVPTLRIRGRSARSEEDKAEEGESPARGLGSLAREYAENRLNQLAPPLPNGFGPVSAKPAAPKPARFVPFGRLIKAELVMTLESTVEEMPLIGLIVEPVYNNGKLIIPAGTELHSTARPDRIRDRIISGTTWRLVFPREGGRPNGRQITFDGIALDREDQDGNNLTWGITDGSYGLRGRALRGTKADQEIMFFAAEALKAFSAGMMERQPTLVGAQLDVSAKNSAIAGGQAVLGRIAERIGKEIERNGVFIQVPAGKQFYVYPRQVIDPDRADIPDNIATVE